MDSVVLGTQQIGNLYQFTTDTALVEMAKVAKEIGLKVVKFRHNDAGADDVMDNLDFKYHFIWYRSEGSVFINGMGSKSKQAEYNFTYEYTKNLLLKYNGTDKEFYLGNWEGDWYLIPNMDPKLPADPIRIMGMIDWIKTRQSAVTNACKDFPSTVKVYYYVEMNRVVDAMEKGMPRLVNSVLPYVTVDYISLSSYDFQKTTLEYSQTVIDYIKTKFNCTTGKPDNSKIIIGEFGIPLIAFKNSADPDKDYTAANVSIFKKYIELGFRFILFWNTYNNELNSRGDPVGYHLVDSKGRRSGLLEALKRWVLGGEI